MQPQKEFHEIILALSIHCALWHFPVPSSLVWCILLVLFDLFIKSWHWFIRSISDIFHCLFKFWNHHLQAIALRAQTHANWVYIFSIQAIIARDKRVHRLRSRGNICLASSLSVWVSWAHSHAMDLPDAYGCFWAGIVATQPMWPAKLKIFTIWLFTVQMCWPSSGPQDVFLETTQRSPSADVSQAAGWPFAVSHSILADQLPLNDNFGVSRGYCRRNSPPCFPYSQ